MELSQALGIINVTSPEHARSASIEVSKLTPLFKPAQL